MENILWVPFYDPLIRKLFSLPPTHNQQIKSYVVSGTKIFLRRYTEIHRHFLSKCFKNEFLGSHEIVQCKCFFWHQTEICLLEYLYIQKVFWLCCGRILLSMSSELRFVKWVRFFEWNCIVKWVNFFASFCGLW